MRAAQGAASSAQATDRSLPGRPESSFPPLGPCSRRGIAIPGPKWPANRAAPFFRLALSATGGASPGNSPHRTRCAAVGGFAALRMRRAPRGVPRQITAGASPRPTVYGNFRASRAFTRRATTGRPYGHGGWHARRGRRAPRAGGSGGGGMISTPTGRGSYPPAGQAPPYPSSSRSTCPAERAKSRAAARASWRVLPWVPTSTSTEPVDSCWLYREERMVMGRARVG